jgi:hypothetical protein
VPTVLQPYDLAPGVACASCQQVAEETSAVSTNHATRIIRTMFTICVFFKLNQLTPWNGSKDNPKEQAIYS